MQLSQNDLLDIVKKINEIQKISCQLYKSNSFGTESYNTTLIEIIETMGTAFLICVNESLTKSVSIDNDTQYTAEEIKSKVNKAYFLVKAYAAEFCQI